MQTQNPPIPAPNSSTCRRSLGQRQSLINTPLEITIIIRGDNNVKQINGAQVSDSPDARTDLNLLNIFDVVMVERHVTRAAERLKMTQSAVSNALNRLRRQFQDQLFVKAARGVAPTPRALELWPRIHQSIEDLNSTVRPQTFDASRADQRFRISAVDLMASLLTPPLYRNVQKLAPRVSISFVPHNQELAASRLMRGEVNFDISIVPPRVSMLQAVPLWSENYVVVARRGHPLLKGELSLAAFCKAPQLVVNLSGDEDESTTIDDALANRGLARNIQLSVNQFSVATTMLLTSNLIGVLPDRLAVMHYARGGIGIRPSPITVADATVYLCWHRRNNALPAHQWFKQRILDAADEFKKDVERLLPRIRVK